MIFRDPERSVVSARARRKRGKAGFAVRHGLNGDPSWRLAGGYAGSLMEQGFDDLDAPVLRVTNEDVPLPYAANLEKAALIDAPRVVAAAKKVCYR